MQVATVHICWINYAKADCNKFERMRRALEKCMGYLSELVRVCWAELSWAWVYVINSYMRNIMLACSVKKALMFACRWWLQGTSM